MLLIQPQSCLSARDTDGVRRVVVGEAQRPDQPAAEGVVHLDAGLAPLDRVVVQLPNVAEFVFLHFALQKIGCVPIAALASAMIAVRPPAW